MITFTSSFCFIYVNNFIFHYFEYSEIIPIFTKKSFNYDRRIFTLYMEIQIII